MKIDLHEITVRDLVEGYHDDDKELSVNGRCPYFRIVIQRRGR